MFALNNHRAELADKKLVVLTWGVLTCYHCNHLLSETRHPVKETITSWIFMMTKSYKHLKQTWYYQLFSVGKKIADMRAGDETTVDG